MTDKRTDARYFTDYLVIVYILVTLPFVVVLNVIQNWFAENDRKCSLKEVILTAIPGYVVRCANLRQIRLILGRRSFEREFGFFAYALLGISDLPGYNSEFAGSGFVARWVSQVHGCQTTDPVILYMYGGGFALNITFPQVETICHLAKTLLKRRVSVLALDYTTTPFARFPEQRNQGLACLAELQRTCSKVILLGDSCGGNLALTMLQDFNIVDHSKIDACVLVSPCTDMASKGGSMDFKTDVLTASVLSEMINAYSSKLEDPLVSPIRADPKIWPQILPTNTLVVFGDAECFYDQDLEFVKTAGISHYFIEKHGTHDCLTKGPYARGSKYIEKTMLEWLK